MTLRSVLVGALVIVAIVVAVMVWRFERLDETVVPAADIGIGSALPPLLYAEGWIHGGPLTQDSLSGQPAVVVLWGATDPRGLAAALRAEAWHEAFTRYGLRVVGVHLPEFTFATELSFLAATARRLGLAYTVAHDPRLRLRERLGAETLPHFIVIDANGRMVAGESGLAALPSIERAIRIQIQLSHPELSFPDEGAAVTPAPATPAFPRPVHLGSARVVAGPLKEARPGRPLRFASPFRHQVEGRPYTPYPVGLWTLGADGLSAERGGAGQLVALRYDAGALGAVLSPPPSGEARVWILRDDRWLDAASRGADVETDGRGATFVRVREPRLYALCRGASAEHVVKLSPDRAGVTLYAFTFETVEP